MPEFNTLVISVELVIGLVLVGVHSQPLVHLPLTVTEYITVLYSDESKFNFFGLDGVQWCCRGPGEALDMHNVLSWLKHGGGG